jgi:hypothetical protein
MSSLFNCKFCENIISFCKNLQFFIIAHKAIPYVPVPAKTTNCALLAWSCKTGAARLIVGSAVCVRVFTARRIIGGG